MQKIRVQVLFTPDLYEKLNKLVSNRRYKNFNYAIQALYEEACELRTENHEQQRNIMHMNDIIRSYESQISTLTEKLRKKVGRKIQKVTK